MLVFGSDILKNLHDFLSNGTNFQTPRQWQEPADSRYVAYYTAYKAYFCHLDVSAKGPCEQCPVDPGFLTYIGGRNANQLYGDSKKA